MSEEMKSFELKDEELEKVSGGFPPFNTQPVYKRYPGGTFNDGDIVVEDVTGIRYKIIRYDSSEGIGMAYTNWYLAEVVYIPDSQMGNTSYGSTKFVNSSFVQLYK